MSKKKNDGHSLIQAMTVTHYPLWNRAKSGDVKPEEMEEMLISALKDRGGVSPERLNTKGRRKAFIKSALSGFIDALEDGISAGAYVDDCAQLLITFNWLRPAIVRSSEGNPMAVQSMKLSCDRILYTMVMRDFRKEAG